MSTPLSVKQVDEALSKVNRGADMKEEMVMTIAPYANWGEFLVPAPLSIALLGQLILISAEADFSLEKKPPKEGFKVLQYPGSFRACLVQVSNAGWEAFNEAHTNMDQIRLHSAIIDKHVKNAVKFLVAGSDTEVKLSLPHSLKNISRIADKCLSLVTSVENKFVFVMKLTAELLEACTNAKGQYEDELKDAQEAIKVAKAHEKAAREQKENATRQCEEMAKEVKECQEKFKEAAGSLPSGWSMIGMALVEGITSSFTGHMNGMVTSMVGKSPAQMKTKLNKNVFDDEEGYDEPKSGQESKEQKANRKIFSKGSEITVQFMSLTDLVDGYEDQAFDWNRLKEDKIRHIKTSLESLLHTLHQQTDTPVKSKAVQLCDGGVKVCDELQDLRKSMSFSTNDLKTIVLRIQKLHIEANSFEAEGKKATGSNPVRSKNPQASKMQYAETKSSVVNAVLQNKRMAIETSKELLKHNQQRYDKSCDSLKESNEKLTNILGELAKHEMKKIDFEKIRKVLIKGMKALAEVREQWGKMVRFFQMLSNIIKCCLHSSLTDFVEQAESGREIKLADMTLSSLLRDMIYEQAFEASKISYLVETISSTYVEVSNNYLMDGITCLGKLIPLDPVDDRAIMQQERQKLVQNSQRAQKAINDLVKKKREEFDEQVESRVAKIERELRSVLPPPTSTAAIKQVEETKAAVKKTLTSTENVDMDQWC